MAEIDPYATLGVPRTATRDEIARAYRALAKRYHPDAGAQPTPTMARINEAWHVLSDPNRRARWDRLHAPVIPPAHWVPSDAPARPIRRPPPPPTPVTVRDSPWLAVGAVAGTMVLVGAALLGISVVGGFQVQGLATSTANLGAIRMDVPTAWTVARGTGAAGDAHRVIAHVVSFPVMDGELCTAFGAPCALSGGAIPSGEASVLITAWSDGEPPVAEPLVPLPAGLQADRMIGGQPAAFELRRTDGGIVAWWQLSPPGFPDDWIEVRADIGGGDLDLDDIYTAVDAMVESIEFTAEEARRAPEAG